MYNNTSIEIHYYTKMEDKKMKIAIGCDPNATEYKKILTPFVEEMGHEVVDFGSDDPIYANTAIRLATSVAAGECDRGILICGTGIGVSIAANKVPGAYAALVNNISGSESTAQ